MKIEKFKLLSNGNVVYAVSGTDNKDDAMDAVRKYRKENGKTFYDNHSCFPGTLYKDKLFVGDVNFAKKKTCMIVARNSYHIEKYVNTI